MVFPKLIYTFLVAMIPAVEVKGAIPFGMALQLAPWQAYLMALFGSFFVVCFLSFFTFVEIYLNLQGPYCYYNR